jgi:hypothetical protein
MQRVKNTRLLSNINSTPVRPQVRPEPAATKPGGESAEKRQKYGNRQ